MEGYLEVLWAGSPSSREYNADGATAPLSSSRRFVRLDREQGEVRVGEEETWFVHEVKWVGRGEDDARAVRLRLGGRGTVTLRAPTPAAAEQWFAAFQGELSKRPAPATTPPSSYTGTGTGTDTDTGTNTYTFTYTLLPLLAMTVHLLAAPFTKVEESFNTHAVHDLLVTSFAHFSTNQHNFTAVVQERFDHVLFPGVVPRTFLGALVVAALALPSLTAITAASVAPGGYVALLLARWTLAGLVWGSFTRFNSAVNMRFPSLARDWPWLLPAVNATQFHVSFYGSRMLPNVFALATCHLAWAHLLRGNTSWSVAWFVFTATVLRCDVLALLGPVAFWVWFVDTRLTSPYPSCSTPNALRELWWNGLRLAIWGLTCFLASLALSVTVDSPFWAMHPTVLSRFFPAWVRWPEGEVLWFNVVENKSSHWGTSPWHWYLTSALPKMALAAYPASFLALGRALLATTTPQSTTQLRVFLPTLAFVGLYSFLPHKEVRFLFPAIPVINLMGALGLSGMVEFLVAPHRAHAFLIRRGLVGGVLCVSLATSLAFLYVSSLNYPGGEAVSWLETYLSLMHPSHDDGRAPPRVHVDAYSAMNGVSLFLYDGTALSGKVKWFKTPEDVGGKAVLSSSLPPSVVIGKFDYLVWETREEWSPPPAFAAEFTKLRCFQGEPAMSSSRGVITREVICVWRSSKL